MEEKQELTLINRHTLTLNTVLHMKGFDEDYIRLVTDSGEVEIGGKDLKVLDLSKDSKKVTVEGDIREIVFIRQNDKLKKLLGGKKT